MQKYGGTRQIFLIWGNLGKSGELWVISCCNMYNMWGSGFLRRERRDDCWCGAGFSGDFGISGLTVRGGENASSINWLGIFMHYLFIRHLSVA
jgi:hypothetical protein